MILNTPLSSKDNEERKTEEEKRTDEDRSRKNQKIYEEIDRMDDEILMKELAIEQTLDMEDGTSRTPIPLTGLTCPLTGEP